MEIYFVCLGKITSIVNIDHTVQFIFFTNNVFESSVREGRAVRFKTTDWSVVIRYFLSFIGFFL